MTWDHDFDDEPPPAWRDKPPDVLVPINPDAPVSGHHGPREAHEPGLSAAHAPEHDWLAAEEILFPVLRPADTHGTRLADVDAARLAAEGMKTHPSPVLDDGPSGLVTGYVLRTGAFDIHVNADHLLAWGATPDELRRVAMANLARWSESAPWTDEVSGSRRLLSSASGGGADATRILLADVRADLVGSFGAGARILVGIPERDLLVAGAFVVGDDEFAVLFAEFIRDHAAGADDPLDPRVHEIVGSELRLFEG